jgi:AcrR family transcriptional regulator
MTAETPLDEEPGSGDAVAESAKRKQILDGARRIFFGRGFDATSMGEIAREAKVSKGTLYVYFDSKEALFSALIQESKGDSAERRLYLDDDDPDVEAALKGFAIRLIQKMAAPKHIALVRMVIGAAEQFPALARVFFEAGPAHGARRLAAYFAAQTQAGRLAVPDPEIAAWHFLGMCNHPTLIAVILAQEPPSEARMARLADAAVATFLAAYAPPPA